MSYEALVEKVKSLPEGCLEEAYTYMQFLMYRHEQEKVSKLKESPEEFEMNLNKGYNDMIQGCVMPLKDSVEEIKRRFS